MGFVPIEKVNTKIAGVTMGDRDPGSGRAMRQIYLEKLKEEKVKSLSLRPEGWEWQCRQCQKTWEEDCLVDGMYGFQCPSSECQSLNVVQIDGNPWDADALALYSRSSRGFFHLGYVANKDRMCPGCDAQYPKAKEGEVQKEVCDACGLVLSRNGLASDIRQGMRLGACYSAAITQVTGGDKDNKSTGQGMKTLGCNILITKTPPDY